MGKVREKQLVLDRLGFFNNNEQWIKFQNQIIFETDRSVAIVCGAMIDEMLKEVISSWMIDQSETVDNFMNGRGVLATFAAKIDYGYVSGLYSKTFMQELNNIREIRNKFAHNLYIDEFTHEKIEPICQKLKIVTEYIRETDPPLPLYEGRPVIWRGGYTAEAIKAILSNPRERYIHSMWAICDNLRILYANSARPKKPIF